MVQFECPRHSNPCLSSISGEFHFLIFSHPLSWIIRIGLSSIKVKKLLNLGNKIGLTGCKWSSLNAPGTETPVSHPFLAEIDRSGILPILQDQKHLQDQVQGLLPDPRCPCSRRTSCSGRTSCLSRTSCLNRSSCWSRISSLYWSHLSKLIVLFI